MLFGADCGDAARAALAENTRGQDALWSLGISGDRPVVLYDWGAEPDWARLSAYLELWTIMRLHRLEFDLCVLGAPENPLPEGVYRIPREVSREVLTALRAAACHTASDAREPAPAEWRPRPSCTPSRRRSRRTPTGSTWWAGPTSGRASASSG